MGKTLLSTKEAAEYLGVTVKTLACWRSTDKGLPYIKRGRIWYALEDINEWLEKGKQS